MMRSTLFTFSLAVVAFAEIGNAADTGAGKPMEMSNVVRVEEDWVVYVRNPAADLGAPQIAHVISPERSTDRVFGMVEVNHQSQPRFNAGGIQVQTWLGKEFADLAYSNHNSPLSAEYDKLSYTVGMERRDGNLNVYLRDGYSRTWGRFAEKPITAKTPKSDIDLSDYDPQYSVENTSINHGAHRVVLMYMRRARYFDNDGQVHTENKPRIIHRFHKVIEFVSLKEYEEKLHDFNIEITEQ